MTGDERILLGKLKNLRLKHLQTLFCHNFVEMFYALSIEIAALLLLLASSIMIGIFQPQLGSWLSFLFVIILFVVTITYAFLRTAIYYPSLQKIAHTLDKQEQLANLVGTAYSIINYPHKKEIELVIIKQAARYLHNYTYKKQRPYYKKYLLSILLLLVALSSWQFAITIQAGNRQYSSHRPSSLHKLKKTKISNKQTPKRNNNRRIKANKSKQQPAKSQPLLAKKQQSITVRSQSQQQTQKSPKRIKHNKLNPGKQNKRKNSKPTAKHSRQKKSNPTPKKNKQKVSPKKKNKRGKRKRPLNAKLVKKEIEPLFDKGQEWLHQGKLRIPTDLTKGQPGKQKISQQHNFVQQADKYIRKVTLASKHYNAVKKYFRLIQPSEGKRRGQ